LSLPGAGSLIIRKEESPGVLAGDQRAAESPAILVHAKFGNALVEEVAGVQRGVAEEFEQISVELVRARLKDDIGSASAPSAEPRVRDRGLLAELFDGVERRE